MDAATHLEPGAVEANGAPMTGLLHLGRYPSGTDAIADQIGADLAGSGFLAPVVADVMRWKYGKLLANLSNAIEAVCGHDAWLHATELRRRVTAEGRAVCDTAGMRAAANGRAPSFAPTACGSSRSTGPNGSAVRPGRA